MTRAEARRVLDAARDGANISTREITEALLRTGDMNEIEAEQSQSEPVQVLRAVGRWERKAGTAAIAPAGPFDGLQAWA